MQVGKTERGFEIIRFQDHNGRDCSLQQSSLAVYARPGTSAIWLGVGEERMHLEMDTVEVLIRFLQNWADTGSFQLTVEQQAWLDERMSAELAEDLEDDEDE